MDDKTLDNIQRELEKEINQDIADDLHISSMVNDISTMLLSHPYRTPSRYQVNDTTYTFSYQANESNILLVVADIVKYKIMGMQYTPFIIRAELMMELTMEENLKAAVEGFIRHILDKIKPEMLTESTDTEENPL